jgi:hypothetical protein
LTWRKGLSRGGARSGRLGFIFATPAGATLKSQDFTDEDFADVNIRATLTQLQHATPKLPDKVKAPIANEEHDMEQ